MLFRKKKKTVEEAEYEHIEHSIYRNIKTKELYIDSCRGKEKLYYYLQFNWSSHSDGGRFAEYLMTYRNKELISEYAEIWKSVRDKKLHEKKQREKRIKEIKKLLK